MVTFDRLIRWIRTMRSVLSTESAARIDYAKLERVLKYRIRSQPLFAEALSHRSYLQHAGRESGLSNERLEFLGDAVLNLVVAEYLYRHHTGSQEGDLTKMRSRLVNRKALSIFAREMKLSDFILLSPSAALTATKGMETILSDAYVAIIGAIYIDGGFHSAKKFIEETVVAALISGIVRTEDENFKSQLLEHAQAEGLGAPRYITINEEGPDHDRTFTIEVFIGNTSYGIGSGKNKKDAEQIAAEKALQQLNVL